MFRQKHGLNLLLSIVFALDMMVLPALAISGDIVSKLNFDPSLVSGISLVLLQVFEGSR